MLNVLEGEMLLDQGRCDEGFKLLSRPSIRAVRIPFPSPLVTRGVAPNLQYLFLNFIIAF